MTTLLPQLLFLTLLLTYEPIFQYIRINSSFTAFNARVHALSMIETISSNCYACEVNSSFMLTSPKYHYIILIPF